ncbi:hypothetical protein ACIQ9E_12830 [Streptomyces sp. NPDC094448]|uniref:hypothetical protein n=1 Tax=Streptomyces sp. NPDC094448 TaxID=3366063 RepID=UPI003828C250
MALTHPPDTRRPSTPGVSALVAGAVGLFMTAVAGAGAAWGPAALNGVLTAVAACAVAVLAGYSLSGSV